MAARDEPDSDIDSDGERKPQLGEGLWGHGPARSACVFGKRRDFSDGFGLCSPGRWAPWQRRCAADTPALAFPEQLGKTLLAFLKSRLDLSKLAKEFAAGAVAQCPFSEELIADGREILFCALASRQCRLSRTDCRSAILPGRRRGAAPHGW